MFNYYGSKGKIVHLYPTPKFDDINEVFAGSARYSLRFYDRNITLVDKYKPIVDLWNFLINASIKDIDNLPKLKIGENIDNYNLSDGQHALLSMFVNVASTGRKTMVERAYNMYDLQIKNIKDNLHKIKHWKIIYGDYRDLKNKDATWFIDPPYQFGGHEYKESNKNIDFKELAEWCKSRNGQIIVCENTKANWLPFKPMVKMQGIKHKTTEAIWSNHKTAFDWQQQRLF